MAQASKPIRLIKGMLVVASPMVLAAQSPALRVSGAGQFVHESWTVENGLPVNAIRRLLQGRDGYLWIATLDGLIRFDGVRFKVYNATTSPELPNNRFVSLHETTDGDLWLETEQKLVFRFRHGRFTRFGPERGLATLAGLMSDTNGVLWAATPEGLGRIDGERFVVKYPDVRGPISAMLHRRDGSVWISMSVPGLLRVVDGRTERVGVQTALDTARVWSIQEDPDGRLWLGTSAGIWTEDGTLRQVANGPELGSIGSFSFPPGSQVLAFSQRGVWSIERDRARRQAWSGGVQVPVMSGSTAWWVEGTRLYSTDGLAWDLASGSTRQALESQRIDAFIADREGSFWLGTVNGGLHRLKPSLFRSFSMAEGLTNANALTVAQDSAGAMWVGTWGGLNRIDASGQVTRFANLPSASASVFSLHLDRANHILVGTGAGLLSCKLPAVTCQREASPALRGAVMALFRDSRGRLWAGAGQGAVLEDGSWSSLAGPTTENVRVFAESRDGAIWMGTNGAGLLRYSDGAFTHINESSGLPSDFVRALHVDNEGWLWVGTEGRGLARIDPRAWTDRADSNRGRIVRIGVEHGLYDPGIHAILADATGRLWMSTNRGIFSVARAELMAVADGRASRVHSTHYTERDGMRNREANGGSQPAGARASDGRLWFPTQDGVVVIDPQEVTVAQRPPPVVIERVQAAERSDVPNGEPLRLAADERDVAIDYTAPSFLEPENLRFRYRLEPYDRDWVDAGNRRTAFYTGLPPGRYSFRVAASGDGLEWSEAGSPVELTVIPLFRETAWARLLLAMSLMALVVAAFQWRVRRLREREHELERVVDERTAALRHNEQQLEAQNTQLAAQAARLGELDHAKSRFFANVSHEFRTPLTLTIGPLEDLQSQVADSAPARRSVDMALRNSRRLLRLVNQILDVARLESAQVTLRPRALDIATFTRGIASAFQPLAESRGIRFDIDTPVSGAAGHFDPDAVEKILANLLSNALKFTPSGGRVSMEVARDHGTVQLRVVDSGPGIPPEHLPHVFERFYQVDETNARVQPGTGIGLSLVHELAKLHGGTVAVASAGANTGATFTVTLPMQVAPAVATEDVPTAVPVGAPDELDGAASEPVQVIASGDDVTTLLVVDDSADMRAYLRDHFASRFRVLEAGGGAAAIEIARTRLPDIVVSDVMMPDVDGHEVVRSLRANPDTDFIPIILLTAQAATENRIAGLERGADDYIAKPFELRELAARIDNLIANRRRLLERFDQPSIALPADADPEDRAFLERVHGAIDSNLENPEFGVAELAHAVFQDRSHMYRRVRELTGEAPSDLLRKARLDRAAALLTGSSGTVADVAYSVGFQSVAYFTRAFQQQFGTTPAAWRDRKSKA